MTLSGVFVPLITPFDENGAVALPALERLAHEVLDAGAAGLVALGTTGEAGALDDAERRAVVDVAASAARERSVPLLVGAGTAAELAALGDRPEVTAALTLVPPFVRPGPDGVVAHFAALAAASPVPIVVYHIPYRTGQPLPVEALRRLAAMDGVVGLKHAVGGIDQDTLLLLADPPAGFSVLGGEDAFISPLLALGAAGGILAAAHLATARFVELADAWQAGDVKRARDLGHRLAVLATAVFAAPNPTVLKGVLHAQGRIPTPAVRLPLTAPDPALVRAAVGVAETLG